MVTRSRALWWERGVIYQVYPRSFQDSDGDGVGDLAGVRGRLDYLQWLGVDAVWLSPIFTSPMADFGYDVADYTGVDPLFGTLDDLDALIVDLHARGMRLLLDFVPNHTSDRHDWFVESRSSRTSARRDWYIWRDPRPDGSPPNAWVAAFGGSAWEWDEQTGQYYFHSFLKEQPDLNWRNPDVRRAMFDVMRFWFGRGVDGFRLDVVNLLSKRFELVELTANQPVDTAAFAPSQVSFEARQRWAASPAIYSIMRQLRNVANEFDDRVLVGEIWLPLRRLVKFYGRNLSGLHMPFNFQLVTLRWRARAIARAVTRYEALLPSGAWPNWVVGNHDRPRIASRVGAAQARVAAVLLLTLRGTPTLYYGDEIGMADVDVPPDVQRDPQGLRGGRSRDPARTPMRWDGSTNAGFTSGTPWLPVGPGAATTNVHSETAQPDSMLTLYRRLLDLRRREPALNIGDLEILAVQGEVFGYVRRDGERAYLVVLNFHSRPGAFRTQLRGTVEVSSHPEREGLLVDGAIELAADEAAVIRLGRTA